VEGFFLERVVQGVAVQSDQDRGFSATVDDARRLARSAQAAARSGPLLFAGECNNFQENS
jgi:hypothetical protein